MKIFLTLTLTWITIALCYSQSVDLSFKLENGKEYKQVIHSKSTIIQEVNGQKMEMGMTTIGSMTFLVKTIDEEGYIMDTRFDELSIVMKMPQETMEFSSEKHNVNDIFSTILAAMKNKPFEVYMSKTGKITKINHLQDHWETVINQFNHLSQMEKEEIKAQVMRAYGPEAIRGNIEMGTAIYPDEPVNIGDQWTIHTKLKSRMSAKMSTDYVFADLTSDYALIKGNSIIESADNDAYIESSGVSMKFDVTGSMTSEIKVDKKTGWIREAIIHQNIKGDAYIQENPQLPHGMKIPMIMKNEMLITH